MYIERFKDDKGDLFIKYPLINNLINDRGWRTTAEANAEYARTVIGTAFALMQKPDESKYGDGHPFKKTADADIKEEIDFAYNYAIGQNVDVTTESGQYKGASGEIPYFGIAKITDPDAKVELEKPDTKLIPTAVSAGIIHEEGPDQAISKYHIVHVAAVSSGAYGPRFVQLSKCNGDALSCLPTLKAASSLSYKGRTGTCPVQVLSSLATKSASSDIIMSAVSTPGPQSFGSGTVSTLYPEGQSTSTQTKPRVKVRINKAQGNNPDEQQRIQQQEQEQSTSTVNAESTEHPNNLNTEGDNKSSLNVKIQQLEKQVQSNTQRWEQREKQYQLEKIIPRELFVDAKNRFNQKAWEAEIQNAMKETASIDLLARYYKAQLMAKQMPEIEMKNKRASSMYYYNPVPVPKGASTSASSQDTDEDSEQRKMKLQELGKMVRGL